MLANLCAFAEHAAAKIDPEGSLISPSSTATDGNGFSAPALIGTLQKRLALNRPNFTKLRADVMDHVLIAMVPVACPAEALSRPAVHHIPPGLSPLSRSGTQSSGYGSASLLGNSCRSRRTCCSSPLPYSKLSPGILLAHIDTLLRCIPAALDSCRWLRRCWQRSVYSRPC